MDPLHPITPGPPAIPTRVPPVDRLRPVSRERDRPSAEERERRRRERRGQAQGGPEDGEPGPGHIDIRV